MSNIGNPSLAYVHLSAAKLTRFIINYPLGIFTTFEVLLSAIYVELRLGESPLSLATFHCSNVKRVIIMSSSVCHWVTKCQIDESGLSFEYFPGYARGSVQSTVRAPNICQRGERAGGRCRT